MKQDHLKLIKHKALKKQFLIKRPISSFISMTYQRKWPNRLSHATVPHSKYVATLPLWLHFRRYTEFLNQRYYKFKSDELYIWPPAYRSTYSTCPTSASVLCSSRDCYLLCCWRLIITLTLLSLFCHSTSLSLSDLMKKLALKWQWAFAP